MRRRSTFVHGPGVEIDSSQFYVSGDSLVIEDLKSSREERLTFGHDELPEELWKVLSQSHELRIRWVSPLNYNATPPFVAKAAPGLHVFYTPLQGQSGDLLCPLLLRVFSSSLKCESPSATFTTSALTSRRFAHVPTFQYHSQLQSIHSLTRYVQQTACGRSDQQCIYTASLLNIADSLDVDYDSIAHTLTLTAYWSRPPQMIYNPISGELIENKWTLTINSSLGAEKVEAGVLSSEPAADPSDVKLSGFLAVVGEDDELKPTLFSFPSRHHALSPSQAQGQRYTVSFPPPTGLHPTMHISFPDAAALTPPSNRPDGSVCALHAYLTLPSAVFADKYQLSMTDILFLQSHNLAALRYISGETNLEAPDYVVKKWGSNILLELATSTPESDAASHSSPSVSTPNTRGAKAALNVTIPLHTRYLPPSPSSGSQGLSPISVSWPVVFWACTAHEGTKFPVNPFDRINLGYDGLFGPRTMFYHLNAMPQRVESPLVETVQVPVLNLESWGAQWVPLGTVIAVLLGFLWICSKLWWTVAGRHGSAESSRRRPAGEQKEQSVDKKKQ